MDSKIIITGIKWTTIEFAFSAIFRFLVKLILAKLVLPSEFGLVGMTSIFIAVVSSASELGMGAALIQKEDNQSAEKLYNTAFWSGLVWGICLYGIMCLIIGPFAASFYNEPLLIKLMPVLSISILVKPLNLIHIVILTREMNFKKLSIINNGATLIAGLIGLLTAYLGFGVWAIAINIFLSTILSVPVLFIITRWKPKFEWIRIYFNEIFAFGMYSTGTAIFSTLTFNVDNLMVGKFLGTSPLGAYTLAFSLTEALRQTISSILNKVMYPVFGQFQNNQIKLKNYFIKIININAIIMYPIMSYLIIFSNEIILGFFGKKWEYAIAPLKVLAFAVMVHLIINSFSSLLRGLGYPNLEFKIIIFTAICILIPSLIFGITQWGLLGAALAILLNKIILVIIALRYLKKYIKISIFEIILALKGPIFALMITSIITITMKTFFTNNHWVILSSMYFIIYIFSIILFEKDSILLLKKKYKF